MSDNLPVSQPDRFENLRPILETVTALTPSLKDRITAAAIHAFMRLPDSSFGWNESGPMAVEMKALAVIACLRYGLMPGTGQVYYLGNKLFISAEGKRNIAGKSPDFKWLSRKIRTLSDDEKAVLFFEDGDRGLAIDAEIMVRGERLNVTGIAIVEKKALDYRSNSGKTLPGLANKKDIYQTLVTRAESDIYKHYLPLEGMETDDGSNRDEIATLPAGTTINTTALPAGAPTPDETRKKRCQVAFESIFLARQEMSKERFKEITGYGVNELAECTDPDRLENIALALQEEKKTRRNPVVKTETPEEKTETPANGTVIRRGRPTNAQRLERARVEFATEMDRVKAAGGDPLAILRCAPLAVLESETVEDIQDATRCLAAWENVPMPAQTETPAQPEVATNESQVELLGENPEVPATNGNGAVENEAYRLIGRYLEKPWITGGIAEALEALQKCALYPQDEAYIAVAVGKARDYQDYSELKKLIALRS